MSSRTKHPLTPTHILNFEKYSARHQKIKMLPTHNPRSIKNLIFSNETQYFSPNTSLARLITDFNNALLHIATNKKMIQIFFRTNFRKVWEKTLEYFWKSFSKLPEKYDKYNDFSHPPQWKCVKKKWEIKR